MRRIDQLVLWATAGGVCGLAIYFLTIAIRLPKTGSDLIVTVSIFPGALIAMCLGAALGLAVFLRTPKPNNDDQE